MSRGRVLIIEDDPRWRNLLRTALQSDYYYDVYEADSLESALTQMRQLKPDVITLDMNLDPSGEREGEGWDILEALDVMPDSPEVIVITRAELAPTQMKDLLRGYDVCDFIAKTDYDDTLLRKIVSKAIATRNQNIVLPLTERELEVLHWIAAGLTNKEIAFECHIALDTVKAHLKSIFSKLGVSNRIEAINRARDSGLLR